MAVVQVTKSNLSAVLQKLKEQIRSAEFIAVSTQKTGECGARHPWRRILPIDTPDTAYLKAKLSAETYQIFQFAVCPFRFHGPKLRSSPYNFHLFPRDELSLGMPSYSFSCQTSFLTSMAQEGFDFNGCIYDGISYLSRVQESRATERNPIPRIRSITSSLNPSVADTIFMGRIKSKVGHWRSACKDPDKSTDGPLVKSLRRLILGGDVYGSRPCLNVDVCTERQVQLVLETVNQIGDDLVPLVVPDTSGEPKSVRVVLTSSAEDKSNLMTEIQNLEEQNIKIRGFREVIDLISESRKPIIAYNCLHDFAFIHSKFLSPLPTSLTEFLSSLRTVFPNIVDVNHLLKEVGPLRKAKSIPAALHYLKRQFFVPVDVEISHQAQGSTTEKCHGHQVVRLTHLFAKLGNLLKIVPGHQTCPEQQTVPIEEYANNFFPFCASLDGLGNDDNVDVGFWRDNAVRRTSTNNLVFLWGFNRGISASDLKHRLCEAHISFADNFELQLVDKTCAVVVFGRPSSAETLLNDMRDEKASSSVLKGMIFQGLKAAGYETYAKACRMGLWEAELADSLTRASNDFANELSTDCCEQGLEIYWCDDFVIKLQDL